MQQCMNGTKIYDIYDLQKCLKQTCVDFEQNVIEAAIDQWRDSLRSCKSAGGGHGWLVGWLEVNVPFQHKYGYIRDEQTDRTTVP